MGLLSISLDWVGTQMVLLSLHHQPLFSSLPHKLSRRTLDAPRFFYTPLRSPVTRRGDDGCSVSSTLSTPPLRFALRVSIGEAERHREWGDARGAALGSEDLGEESQVFKKTLRLVECAMFASVSGLAYFLSNSLAVENYFSCFFSLPIVLSSMRWGVAAGRKTMVATVMLLLTLSGSIKASTYMLMHGVVGLAMGTLWRLRVNWATSIVLCTLVGPVRALGALGYVLLSSFLIRENILALITINIHASLTYIFTAMGVNAIPSMNVIYLIFGTLLLLNCAFFVFLLHVLYAIFLSKLGLKNSLTLPAWLENAV